MTTSQSTVGDTAHVKAMALWLQNLETFSWLSTPEPEFMDEAMDTYFGVAQDVLAVRGSSPTAGWLSPCRLLSRGSRPAPVPASARRRRLRGSSHEELVNAFGCRIADEFGQGSTRAAQARDEINNA